MSEQDRAASFDRGRPGPLRRFFFKTPAKLYRGILAEIMRRRCVLLLTTTGRRSGQPRSTTVSFMPVDGRLIIFSGWGIRSDWYKNIQANQDVTVQVGRRTMRATAVPVADPARRRELMLRMRSRSGQCGPPEPVRSVLKIGGMFDYEGDLDLAVAQGGELPVVEIIPEGK